jgi:hypothetical protein
MGTGVGEAMLISAATGGGMAAVTGGDPLKGALLGAVTGGVGHGIAGATAAGGANAATILPSTGAEAASANLATSGGGALPGLSGPATGNLSSVAGVQPSGPASLAPGSFKTAVADARYDPEKYKRQMATGGLADTAPAQRMMQGSQLGSYSDGGQLLSGPGNGMSDDIPASIGGKQPARLADGEFVIPADVVSGIGNGSTGAGADELYKLLDRVRLARTGSDKQGREISPMKYLPT